ncbi:Nef protein [Simian immunodeficiency virus]|uniref:Protein Nef n=1 Tax=Simian immunodeficiency virus TaxID=11723 RepID=Q9WPN9_SIV|nr:Nef protein [Simian immunodeficiency virus]
MGNAFGRPSEVGWVRTLFRLRAGSGTRAEPAGREYHRLRRQEVEPLVSAENGGPNGIEQEEVEFPVRPQRPLCKPTYKQLIDLSHFIKEKGGLEGLWYSRTREEILDLYAENEWGFITGWQDYTKGPGVRYPKAFGWLWKLAPVTIDEDRDPNHPCQALLHSSQQGVNEDPWGERLIWTFDPTLAYDFRAIQKHPEEFKHVTSLQWEV